METYLVQRLFNGIVRIVNSISRILEEFAHSLFRVGDVVVDSKAFSLLNNRGMSVEERMKKGERLTEAKVTAEEVFLPFAGRKLAAAIAVKNSKHEC